MKRITIMASLAVALALSAAAMLPAQEKAARSPTAAAQEELGRGHYLAAIDALKRAAYAPDGTVRDPIALQVWQQFMPFMTNELEPSAPSRRDSDEMLGRGWATKIAAAMPRDAITEIVRRAQTTSIVILNEAHGSPRDRAFGLEVARALRPLGYSMLAVEAIRTYPVAGTPLSGAEQLKADGFARMGTGDYTRDPVFAGFLRQALALGYEPVAYDATTAQMTSGGGGVAGREQAQADNLVAAIFAKRPAAKVFLYVGVSHVAEAPLGGTERMAARLKRITGIDPLTIDQATLTDVSARSAYDLAAARIGDRPAIFFANRKPMVLGLYAGAVDLQIVHPRRSYRFGRPAWLAALGGRPVPIPKDLVPNASRRLVQVFAANAPADAVPLDQVLVEGSAPMPMMMVPPQPFRFEAQR
jgi:hypothetical protein